MNCATNILPFSPDTPREVAGAARRTMRRMQAFLTLFALLFCLPIVHAAEVNVTANVSSTTTTLGEPIRLTVTITGARNANVPPHIAADGLDINLQGKSQRFELSSGFGATMSTVVTYLVTPQKEQACHPLLSMTSLRVSKSSGRTGRPYFTSSSA